MSKSSQQKRVMDTRRTEFRRWLDYEGILDAYTKLFVTMFQEEKWPEDTITYARTFFGSVSRAEIDEALAENARLKEEVAEMEAKAEEVRKQLEETTQ